MKLIIEDTEGITEYPINSTIAEFIDDLMTMRELYHEGEIGKAERRMRNLKIDLDDVMRDGIEL